MSDRMRDLLDGLALDATRVPLADPAAVRRRGRQRTGRQIGASVITGAAIVVAVALLSPSISNNLGDHKSVPPATFSPSTPSPSTSGPSTSPTDQPSLKAPIPVPAGALLKASDLPGSILYESDPFPTSVQPHDRANPDWPCAPAASPGAAGRTTSFRTGSANEPTWIDERVETFADDSSATAAMDAITSHFTACTTSTSGVVRQTTSSETGLGDAAALFSIEVPGTADHSAHEVWLEVARTGSVVVWMDFEYYTQDVWAPQDVALQTALLRLCGLGAGQAGQCLHPPIVRSTTYDSYLPAVDPSTLTPRLLSTAVGSYWTANNDERLGVPDTCTGTATHLESLSGAVIRTWESQLVDTYGTKLVRSNREVGENIHSYASAEAASSDLAALTKGMDECTDAPMQRVGTGLVWKEKQAGSLWTIGTQGTHLVILELMANGDAAPFTVPQVNAVLTAALAQLS